MSLSASISSKYGAPIDDFVLDQLNSRALVNSKRVGRTQDQILYLNSPTAWVRICSGVDIKEGDDFSSEYAKNNIIFAGTSTINGLKGGYRPDDPINSAYTSKVNDQGISEFGIKPMGGLTSMDVKCHSPFGLVKEAKFGITVPSINDLDLLEQLYLRPGYYILLEYGHSMYLDNSGELVTMPKTFPLDKFFGGGMKNQEINDIIYQKRQENFGNYDAIYGPLTSFAWSFDGSSYVIESTMIGQSAVMQYLPFLPAEDGNDSENNKSPERLSTDIHRVLSAILYNTNKVKTFINETDTVYDSEEVSSTPKEFSEGLFNALKTRLTQQEKKLQVLDCQIIGDFETANSNIYKYITLGTFLTLLNESVLVYDKNGDPLVRFYTDNKELDHKTVNELEKADKEPVTPFLTFDEHFGIDPRVCVLGKSSKVKSKLTYPVAKQVNFSEKEQKDILNIFVSIELILEYINKAINSDEITGNSAIDVVKNILNDIQKNLGNVNEFDFIDDPDTNLVYIIDRKVVPSESDFIKDGTKPRDLIDVVGLQSDVESVNFKGSLDKNLVSMASVAATSKDDSGTNAELFNLMKFNENLRDRHGTGTKFSKGTKKKNTEEEPVNIENVSTLISFLRYVTKNNAFYILQDADISHIRPVFNKAMTELVLYNTKKQKTNRHGQLPFNVTIVMRGVGGIKINTRFKLQDRFLPKRYRGTVVFMTSSVNHSFRDNRWTTEIEAYMVSSETEEDINLKPFVEPDPPSPLV